jgi:hypothetical protein
MLILISILTRNRLNYRTNQVTIQQRKEGRRGSVSISEAHTNTHLRHILLESVPEARGQKDEEAQVALPDVSGGVDVVGVVQDVREEVLQI